jgi:transcriptional regulator GlxA family with amidase domain
MALKLRRAASLTSDMARTIVLAATGALDGLRATTHWRAAPELARRHPEIDVDPDVLYVDNGHTLTSAGAAAGLDLCLRHVRRDLGADAAARVAREVVMPLERAGGQAQFVVHEPPAGGHTSFAPLLAWMEQNLSQDVGLPALARQAAMSTRTLSRRFREQVGTTPARWIVEARVRRAQRLLEKTYLSVEMVAAESGFGSAAGMREHFAGIVGTTPLDYRRSFTVV